MAVEVTATRKRPQRFQLWAKVLASVVLFLILAWTGFWLFAAWQAASSLDAWIAREKVVHRNWSCPDRHITGFPVAIRITCSKPGFAGMIFGRPYSGSLAGFVATAEFSHPSDVTVNVSSPFAARSDDKTVDMILAWDRLAIVLGGLPQDVTAISVAGQGLSLQGHAEGLGALAARAQQVTAVLTHDVARPDRAIHFLIGLNGASFPAVDTFLGAAAPVEIMAEGDVTQASFDPAKTLVATLDQWRAAGGRIDFTNLAAIRGETKFQARGTLGLDAAHELEGRLDARCLGFESVLRRLGVDPALIAVGSLLTNLLGGGDTKSAGPQPLHLPVAFTGGRLSIGPVSTSIRVPPLY